MKFKIITLGCKVNTYESNFMAEELLNEGYVEVENNADVVIVNTCSVTNVADKKSLKMVRSARKNNPNAILIVVGCMTQNNRNIFDNDPSVNIVLGNKYKSKIVELIKEFKGSQIKKIEDLSHTEFESMKLNDFDKTRAYVKIQDGCNNFCSYCIIPYTRGVVRSKDMLDVIDEVKLLAKKGKKEIVLTGIHTGNYGRDLGYSLSKLLKELVKIDGIERIRISSIEITELDEEFMNVLKDEKKIVDHIHIPLQSGSDDVLKAMNRKYDKEYFINKINEIKNIRKDISITTDVIVGFPTETDENFNECIETIKTVNFSKVHVFPYSKREGTKACLLNNIVSDKEKKKRSEKLLKLSEELEINYMNKFLNKEKEVLIEKYDNGYLMGHTDNYLNVKVKGDIKNVHQFIKVKFNKIDYPFIIGDIEQ